MSTKRKNDAGATKQPSTKTKPLRVNEISKKKKPDPKPKTNK